MDCPLAKLALRTLATVCTTTFFVVLPVLNLTFTTLIPYSMTFASKTPFVVAMGLMLAGANYEVAADNISRHLSV